MLCNEFKAMNQHTISCEFSTPRRRFRPLRYPLTLTPVFPKTVRPLAKQGKPAFPTVPASRKLIEWFTAQLFQYQNLKSTQDLELF